MKIILLQDVAKIGRRHSVVDVPDGYALNKLIPKKLAEPATPENLKKIKKKQADTAAHADAAQAQFDAAVAALKDVMLEVKTQVNEQGHLFKAVSADDIVAAAQAHGVTIAAKHVVMNVPIKESGTHTISLVHAHTTQPLQVTITKK